MSGTAGEPIDVLALGLDSSNMDRAADQAVQKLDALKRAAIEAEDAWERFTRAGDEAAAAHARYQGAATATIRANEGTARASQEVARQQQIAATALDAAKRSAIAAGVSFEDLQKVNTTLVAGMKSTAREAENTRTELRTFGGGLRLTAFEARNLSYQITDVFQQLAAGTPVWMTFMQQGPQMVDALGGVSEAFSRIGALLTPVRVGVAAITLALLGSAVAAEKADRALLTLQNRTMAFRGDAASFAQSAAGTVRQVARTSGMGVSEGMQAAATLGSAGVPTADMERALRVAQDLSKAMGTDLATAAKRVADAFREPEKAARAMADEGFRTMDAAGVRSVRMLELMGDRAGAAAQVMRAMQQATQGADANITPLQQSLRDLANGFGRLWDAVKPAAEIIGTAFLWGLTQVVNLVTRVVEGFGAMARGIGEIVNQARTLIGLAPAQGPAAPDPAAEERARTLQAAVNRAGGRAQGNRAFRMEELRAERQGYEQALQLNPSPEQARMLRAALVELGREYAGMRGPMEEYLSGLARQIELEGVAAGAARTLAEAEAQADAIARQAGQARASETDRWAARELAQARLTAALDQHIKSVEQETALINGPGGAVDAVLSQTGSVLEAEIAVRAHTEALRYAVEGSAEYRAATLKLTAAYVDQKAAQSDLQSLRNTEDARRGIQMLEAETRLLGQSVTQRERELAMLRERQRILAAGGDVNTPASQAAITGAADLASARVEADRLRGAYDEIGRTGMQAFDRIGEAITQSFATGESRAIRFSNVLRGLQSELAQMFARLAIVNPIMNAVAGTNRPTLGAVAQVGGAQGGGFSLSNLSSLSGISNMLGGKGSMLGRALMNGDGANISQTAATATDAFGKTAASLDISTNAAAASPGLFSNLSMSSLGMAAMGFGAGSLIGGLVAGDSRARQTNSQIGAGLGAVAGLALTPVLGPFAPLLGGALGGGLGGLIGPGKGFEGGDAWAQLGGDGLLRFDGARGKGFDTDPLAQQLRAEVQQTNQAIQALGLRFAPSNSQTPGQFGFATIGGGDSGHARSLAEALDRSGQFRSLTGGSAAMNQVIQGASGFEEAMKAAQWVQQVYDPLVRLGDATKTFGNAIEDLRKPFDDAIQQAQRYGLATEGIVAARDRQIAQAQRENFRAIQDNDVSLWQRSAEAGGNRREILGEQQNAFRISSGRQREDLEEFMATRGVTGQWAADIRARLEKALAREGEALAKAWEELWRDQRIATESITSRLNRASAARSGNASAAEFADLYDFDAKARVEIEGTRESLAQLGFSAQRVTAEISRLTQAHNMEREAIVAAYAERRRQAQQALDDRLFAASNDNSTEAGALAAFDRAAQRERLAAIKEGLVSIVDLERTQAAERAAVVKQFADQAAAATRTFGGSIRQYLDSLKTSREMGGTPATRFAAAQDLFGRDLALARGGDQDALGRITSTADTLLQAGQQMFGSTREFEALMTMVTSSLSNLPATKSYDQMILEELRKMGGSVDVSVALEVVRVITEAINALPAADRQKLIQTQTVLRTVQERIGRFLSEGELARLIDAEVVKRSIEQTIGRDLTAAERAGLVDAAGVQRIIEQTMGINLSAAERASLVQGATVERLIEQSIGRALTTAEREGLVEAAKVTRSVEQVLGRNLTPTERAMIVLPESVTRTISQSATAPTGASIVQPGTVTRTVTQSVETTETVKISRSIDEKLGAQLYVHAALLSEIVKGTYAVSHNTANMQRLLGGERGLTSFVDPSKADLFWRFRANANAALQGLGKEPGMHGFDDLRAGGNQMFASGGMFENGIVTRPTLFNIGEMGEAGPEAIMPLARTSDGNLGVRMLGDATAAKVDLSSMERELKKVTAQLEALRRERARDSKAVIQATHRVGDAAEATAAQTKKAARARATPVGARAVA